MKILLKILIITFFGLIISCNKDESNQQSIFNKTNNSYHNFLDDAKLSEKSLIKKNGKYYESGYSFIPNENGTISTLIVSIPEINKDVQVSIWDVSIQNRILTQTINVDRQDVEITKNIAPLELFKGKEYAITIYSNSYYVRNKLDFSDINYPISEENITYTGSYISENNKLVLSSKGFFGDVSFKFQTK
jgi:hypothetical protein